MSIYAISDLHLAFNKNKPMEIFGDNWKEHYKKIKLDWESKVNEKDLVLLPGDFSWAMDLKGNLEEFRYLEELPGKKILLKGNHDYWWNSLGKMSKFLEENDIKSINFLHNNSYLFEDYIIAGTRGWEDSNTEDDLKILKREWLRLELSLKDGVNKYGNDKKIIVNMHYPPFIESTDVNFIDLMNNYSVEYCIYGHIHGKTDKEIECIESSKIKFKLVSCDYLDFKLYKII